MSINKKFYGKASSLTDTISKQKALLKKLNIEVEITSEKHPVSGIYSLHLRDAQIPELYVNGKGPTKNAALASAFGEFFERYTSSYLFSDYHFDEKELKTPYILFPTEKKITNKKKFKNECLNPELWNFYFPNFSPEFQHLIDYSFGQINNGILCLPFKSFKNETTTYFPVNILENLYVSNGMASGNTFDEAYIQGLSEIIERHVKFKIIRKGLCLPDIPLEHYKNFDDCTKIINALKQKGFDLLIKDASLGGQFPVTQVTLIDKSSNSIILAFGAHPIFQVALQRTLTELLQGQDTKNLLTLSTPTFEENLYQDEYNLIAQFIDSSGYISWEFFKDKPDFDFHPWGTLEDIPKQKAFLQNIITSKGFDIFTFHSELMGIPSYQIIVPGFSEIYPIQDLTENNKNTSLYLRDLLTNLPNLPPKQISYLYDELNTLQFPDEKNLAELLGIYISNDQPLAFITLGEIKFYMALFLDKTEEAILYCQWALNSFEKDNPFTLYAEYFLNYLESLNSNDQLLLKKVYSDELIKTCSIIIKKQKFSPHHKWFQLRYLPSHQALLKAFLKRQNLHLIKNK